MRITRVVEIRGRLVALEPRRPGRLKDLAEAYKSTVGSYRIVGPPEAAEAAFRVRFEVLGRLHELDPAEPWGTALPRNPVGVLDRDARNVIRVEQSSYSRRVVDAAEKLVAIRGGASRISESIDAYLTLLGALIPNRPRGTARPAALWAGFADTWKGSGRPASCTPPRSPCWSRSAKPSPGCPPSRPPPGWTRPPASRWRGWNTVSSPTGSWIRGGRTTS